MSDKGESKMKKNNKMRKVIAIVLGSVMILAAGFGMGMALNPNDPNLIGTEAAIEIALEHAGVTAEEASRVNARLTIDDGRRVYDVEFRVNGVEFWFEIVARTGEIHDFGVEGVENGVSNHNENTVNQDTPATMPEVLPEIAPETAPGVAPEVTPEVLPEVAPDTTPNDNAVPGPSTFIAEDRAIDIALAHAGVAREAATTLEIVLTMDDGIKVFDVEFIHDGVEFWYEIVAATGEIHDFGSEIND